MAEKASAGKNDKKKKNHGELTNDKKAAQKKKSVPKVNPKQNKKEKDQKIQYKPSKRKSDSFLKNLFITFLIQCLYIFIFLGFFYLVDKNKFMDVKQKFGHLLLSGSKFLPEKVANVGILVVSYIDPVIDGSLHYLGVAAGYISNYFGSHPNIKAHWENIKDISSISGERVVDYIRTLFQQVTVLFDGEKKN